MVLVQMLVVCVLQLGWSTVCLSDWNITTLMFCTVNGLLSHSGFLIQEDQYGNLCNEQCS